MRRQYPESGCVRGHVQALVMRYTLRHANYVVNSHRWANLNPELVFRERERERKAPLIRVEEVELPLREPSNDALGLGRDEGAESKPTDLRARAPRVSHQVKAVPSGVGVRPCGQSHVRLQSQCCDAAADGAPRTFVMVSSS
jgi:hypothetical protein